LNIHISFGFNSGVSMLCLAGLVHKRACTKCRNWCRQRMSFAVTTDIW